MAGISFTVELQQEEAQRALSDLVARMERPIGFYKNVRAYLTEVAIPRNFASQAAPDGTPWASLSAVTLARREKAGQASTSILIATGTMKASITSEATDRYVRVGTPVIQAAVMQFGAAQGAFGRTSRGGRIPWGAIPARPYLGLSPADETEILAIAADWLAAE